MALLRPLPMPEAVAPVAAPIASPGGNITNRVDPGLLPVAPAAPVAAVAPVGRVKRGGMGRQAHDPAASAAAKLARSQRQALSGRGPLAPHGPDPARGLLNQGVQDAHRARNQLTAANNGGIAQPGLQDANQAVQAARDARNAANSGQLARNYGALGAPAPAPLPVTALPNLAGQTGIVPTQRTGLINAASRV